MHGIFYLQSLSSFSETLLSVNQVLRSRVRTLNSFLDKKSKALDGSVWSICGFPGTTTTGTGGSPPLLITRF